MSPRKKTAPEAKPRRGRTEHAGEQPDEPDDEADDQVVDEEADDGLELEQGVCQFCHCTDEAGCPLGCAWVEGTENTVCTACEDLALDLGYAALEALVEAEGPIRR